MSIREFVREFARSPLDVAAVAPSSPALAEQVSTPVPESGDPVVVELGAGTGAFSAAIQRRLGARGRHIAVEVNPRLAACLRERHPDLEVVVADAKELGDILADRGLAADVVVSGLPWSAYRTAGTAPLHQLLAASLVAGGVLTQVGYASTRWAPPARWQVRDLRAVFEEVTTSRTVWRNLPPAVVHYARRPRRAVRPARGVPG